MFSLKGKTALVTGANQGLGYAMCLGLAKAGANIMNVGRRENDENIRQAVQNEGVRYCYYRTDLSKANDQEMNEIVKATVKEYGHLDILLNNAGSNIRQPFLSYDVKNWDYIIQLNLKAVFLLSKSVANQMVEQKTGGKIINIASMLSYTGGILTTPYTASKSAIMGMTKTMANELAIHKINCNCIAPGYMDTPLTKPMQEDPIRNKEILDRIPAGYWGKPEDLQGAVIFLASSASDYVCGATIPVDGGWLSR